MNELSFVVDIVRYFSHLISILLISCKEHQYLRQHCLERGEKKKKSCAIYRAFWFFSSSNWKGLGVSSDCNCKVLAGN